LARTDRAPPSQRQFQVSWPACSRERHYFRTFRQRAKLGIGDKDRSEAYQGGYSEQELIGGEFFSINTRLNEGELLNSPASSGLRAMPVGEVTPAMPGPANCSKWLTVSCAASKPQKREAMCVDKIRA
jgi:hypothetical protein